MKPKAQTAPCPICGKSAGITAANHFRPFCRERCKLVDLGRWLDGKYAFPGEPAVGFDEQEWADAMGSESIGGENGPDDWA